jgi:hypothetical protein
VFFISRCLYRTKNAAAFNDELEVTADMCDVAADMLFLHDRAYKLIEVMVEVGALEFVKFSPRC